MATVSMPKTVSSPNNSRKNSIWCEIVHPKSKFVNICNHILLLVGVLSLYIDPLLFYLPVLNDSGAITLDWKLGICFALLRSSGDLLLVLGIIFRFRTGYEERALHGFFGKEEFVEEPRLIAIKYLKSTFTIDFLASLPFPQVYLSYHMLALRPSPTSKIYDALHWMFQIQFLPRAYFAFLYYKKIEKATGIAIRSPWSGTLYILFVYGMLSHYLGALYYSMYAVELLLCSKTVIKEANSKIQEVDQLLANCLLNSETKEGVLSEAFANDIGLRSFTQKYVFCFSWGLKTLSSMGQNLKSSAVIVDSLFNLFGVIVGLMLFADLIARMQTCMQSVGEVEEQQMIRQRELEEWANFHHLPLFLKKRILQTVQSQIFATRRLDDEAMLDSLPLDLRCEIRRHFYMEHVCNLSIFQEIDDQLLHAVCGHLRKFTAMEGMYLILEGDPVQQLLFIFSGQVELFSINGGSSRCITAGPGGLCGQELLSRLSESGMSTPDLPPSVCTIKCLSDVEAFSLRAKDLKHLVIQFNYDQKFFDTLLRHSFKFSNVL